jgi:hypothetical protein
MATRQMHPAQDAQEMKVHTRLKVFDILIVKGLDVSEAKEKAREIADSFTDDYEE